MVLVQVENEYANLKWTRGDDMLKWTTTTSILSAMPCLNAAITVPLISCAGYCAGTVECVNAHHPADQMPGFREDLA